MAEVGFYLAAAMLGSKLIGNDASRTTLQKRKEEPRKALGTRVEEEDHILEEARRLGNAHDSPTTIKRNESAARSSVVEQVAGGFSKKRKFIKGVDEEDAQEEALAGIGGSIAPPGMEPPGMKHCNMVPYLRGKLTQNVSSRNRATEGKLATYTGQFKDGTRKTEQRALFEPKEGVGISNIYGWDGNGLHRDKDRYVPSVLDTRHGERPFEQQQVGPGLGLGGGTFGAGGFHSADMLRIMPKTLTELRIDPVVEQRGSVIQGANPIKKREMEQIVSQNKPKILIENKRGERNFTTTGEVKGRTLRPRHQLLKDTNRQNTWTSIFGVAKSAGGTGKHRKFDRDTVKPTRRQGLRSTPFRNMVGGRNDVTDYGRSSYRNWDNTRSATGPTRHIVGARPSTLKHITYDPDDVPDVTRKETTINNGRMYGDLAPAVMKKHITYDPDDVPDVTRKETTIDNAREYGDVAPAVVKKHITYDPDDVPDVTRKETLIDNGQQFVGGAKSYMSATRKRDDVYNARFNAYREKVLKGRKPTQSSVKMSPSAHLIGYVEPKKLESDRVKTYTGYKSTSFGNMMFNPQTLQKERLTSVRNALPEEDTRLDTSLLDAYKSNPLTQSLQSAM